MTFQLWTTDGLREHVFPKPRFLCEPLVPSQGIVLLHGPSEAGKTQLVLTLIKALTEGTLFLRQFACSPSRVLLVEIDTPEMIMQERLQRWDISADARQHVLLLTHTAGAISVPHLIGAPPEAPLAAAQAFLPDLVIFDALRNVHQLDENDSRTTALVYSSAQRLFPDSALLFVHHDRKRDPQGHRVRDEEAAGTAAWRNAANVGLHMERFYDAEQPFSHFATLGFSKLRVEVKPRPIRLRMDDETLLVYPTELSPLQHAEAWKAERNDISTRYIVDRLLEEKLCSRATAYRIAKRLVGDT